MKHLTLLAFLCLSSLLCKAQFNWYDFIGKNRDSIRNSESTEKINLIKSGISDNGNQYDMYSIFQEEDAWHLSEVFYYNINYLCIKVKLIMDRDNAPEFIENTLNINLHRLDNKTWISKDAKYVVALTISPGDKDVTFDYIKREDFLK